MSKRFNLDALRGEIDAFLVAIERLTQEPLDEREWEGLASRLENVITDKFPAFDHNYN